MIKYVKNLFKKIPGFKSGKWYVNLVVAILYCFYIQLCLIGLQIDKEAVTLSDKIYCHIDSTIFTFMFFIFPYIFLFDLWGLRSKVVRQRGINSKSVIGFFLGGGKIALIWIALVFIYTLSFRPNYSDEYSLILSERQQVRLEAKAEEKAKAEEERLAKEAEEKAKAEEERLAKEAEEKAKAGEERLAKEAEEKAKAEEERLAKEAEEKAKAEEERLAKEAEEKAKAEEERLANEKIKKNATTVIKQSLKKNKSGIVNVTEKKKNKVLTVLKENGSNSEVYDYILKQIDKEYSKYISTTVKKIKKPTTASLAEVEQVLDNISYLVSEELNLEKVNKYFEVLTMLSWVIEDIEYANQLEAPSEHLNMEIDLDALEIIDVYVDHRIKNANSILGLKEYSDYYFASSYEVLPYIGVTPTDDFELVIQPLSRTSMKEGVMSFQVVKDGTTTLTFENGFEKTYPLYKEVSEEYIENRRHADEYYEEILTLPLMEEEFDFYLKTLKKINKGSKDIGDIYQYIPESLIPAILAGVKNYGGLEEQTFGFVETTSELKQDGYDFNPYNLVDGDYTTAWVEGVSGFGENEVITFYNHKYLPTSIQEIHIVNGYNAEGTEVFDKNSRVKEIKIEFEDGTTLYETLKDTSNVQVIKLDKAVSTGVVKVTILSVYPGTKYEDTCLSEITFY